MSSTNKEDIKLEIDHIKKLKNFFKYKKVLKYNYYY